MQSPSRFLAGLSGLLALITCSTASAAGAVFYGPTPYTSSANIPAGFYQGGAPTFLDSLEDGSLGGSVSANFGNVYGPAGNADSVDADDGSINGLGTSGRSWFYSSGFTGVTFTFNTSILPTAAALVWTDGAGSITFSARDGDGNSLGSFNFTDIPDSSFLGTTAEDSFFGVQFAGGIKSITIANSSGGIEIDHIQYGIAPVPEPETYGMLLAGLGLMGFVARRRKSGMA